MATSNKDFKIKQGLIVEGSTATVGGHDVITDGIVDAKGDILVASGADAIARLGVGTNGQVLTAASGATYGVQWSDPAAVGVFGSSIEFEGSTADGFETTLAVTDPTADRTITLPDATGTVALTSDITTHANLTEAHGATGAVVGTTNTQTLTNKTLTSPVINTPTGITKSDVGLANVDNTTDLNKPVSTATQTALDLKANLASPTFTGTVTLPEGTVTSGMILDGTIVNGDINASAAIAQSKISGLTTDLAAKAPLASPALTGTPTAPTATAGTNNTQVATTAYADAAVAALVDGAPALLNTLNELAAAINDDAGFTTTITNSIGLKAPIDSPTFTGTVTLPSGTVTSGMIADGTIATADIADSAITSAKIADGTIVNADINASAAIAQSKIDGLSTSFSAKANLASPTFTGTPSAPTAAPGTDTTQVATTAFVKAAADAATAAAQATANALTTDDVAEGTAQYFTDARAKSSAASLLTGATLTNITITGSGSGLVITAENGVADSTTTNLAEGTNLYFTDARARTAVDGTTRSFTAVEFGSIAKQVAATISVPTASAQTAHSFAKATYRSAEYLVKVAYGDHTEISKVLLTLDVNDNVSITEYGIVSTTSGSASAISADVSGADVRLRVTTANNTSTVTVVGTLLA
jgi:hypothetical protein